jgi:hypothetical protein
MFFSSDLEDYLISKDYPILLGIIIDKLAFTILKPETNP